MLQMSERRRRESSVSAATEKAVTLRAYFDGEQIRLDEPFNLKPGTSLTVTVWPEEDPERDEWAKLSMKSLAGAFGEDEPEYSLDLIKRPNPEYEGR